MVNDSPRCRYSFFIVVVVVAYVFFGVVVVVAFWWWCCCMHVFLPCGCVLLGLCVCGVSSSFPK